MILKKNLFKEFDFFVYKKRHLLIYIVIGFFSIFVELQIRKTLLFFDFSGIISSSFSVCIGILLAFLLNIKINFKVPNYFFYRSLMYFGIISISSYLFQTFIRISLEIDILSFEVSRFLISGTFFLIGYFFHLKFTFKDTVKVGVAMYANEDEDIKNVYQKIGQYPDFIHVDITDKTMFKEAIEAKVYRIEVIKALWPNHQIHTHIMSKYPSKWLPDALKYSDIIYFHYECIEDHLKLIKEIKNKNVIPGIVLHAKNNYKNIKKIVENFNEILILSIENPGFSGQKFLNNSFKIINEINNLPNRSNLRLCVDGGVASNLISKFVSDRIVSGSDVLNNSNPKRQIMKLQTLSRYEK